MEKSNFVNDLSHWNSYWPLLWKALEETTGPVLEFGMGDGSTKKLHDYCQARGRSLFSYDYNNEWAQKFMHLNDTNHKLEYVQDWDNVTEKHREEIGVLFVDHSPGEHRKYEIAMFCNSAKIIIAHDTEKESDHGYRVSLVDPLFKYKKHDTSFVARATAYSNFIDVTQWIL